MKKSPLSMPGGVNRSNYFRNRSSRRSYGYCQGRQNYQQISSINNLFGTTLDADIIPLDSSSPVFSHHRDNWQQSVERRNQYFSNTGISESYNQKSSIQSSPTSHYTPQKYQHNYQQKHQFSQKNEYNSHRNLPITEFIDIRSIFEDPWKELEKNRADSKAHNAGEPKVNNSVEIIFEKNEFQCKMSDNVNINTSIDEIRLDTTIELPLQKIGFNQDSKGNQSDESTTSQSSNKSQNESIVEIISNR